MTARVEDERQFVALKAEVAKLTVELSDHLATCPRGRTLEAEGFGAAFWLSREDLLAFGEALDIVSGVFHEHGPGPASGIVGDPEVFERLRERVSAVCDGLDAAGIDG